MKYVLIVFFSVSLKHHLFTMYKKEIWKQYYILSQGCYVCKSFVKTLFGQILLFAQMF